MKCQRNSEQVSWHWACHWQVQVQWAVSLYLTSLSVVYQLVFSGLRIKKTKIFLTGVSRKGERVENWKVLFFYELQTEKKPSFKERMESTDFLVFLWLMVELYVPWTPLFFLINIDFIRILMNILMSYFIEVQKSYRPPPSHNFSLTTMKNNFHEWKMG